VTHPPLFTVEQSQALRGTNFPAGTPRICSSRTRRMRCFLVVAPEDGSVELKTLHHKLGAGRFSFGSADLMLELLGVTPGAVTAFRRDERHERPRERRAGCRLDAKHRYQLFIRWSTR